MSSTQLSLRQNTNESNDGIILRQRTGSTILDEASEAGIVAPITNNITQEDFSKLEIINNEKFRGNNFLKISYFHIRFQIILHLPFVCG
mgnify:CR=1 FL=1